MNEKIDLSKYEGHTEGEWDWLLNDEVPVQLLVVPQGVIGIGVNPEDNVCDADMTLIADAPLLLEEVKRYYGFVDELLTYFHHTVLENESFMDLMYRMGVFEFEPEPWQNEKGEWMMFVGDTYETGEWVVDKDFKPNQGE